MARKSYTVDLSKGPDPTGAKAKAREILKKKHGGGSRSQPKTTTPDGKRAYELERTAKIERALSPKPARISTLRPYEQRVGGRVVGYDFGNRSIPIQSQEAEELRQKASAGKLELIEERSRPPVPYRGGSLLPDRVIYAESEEGRRILQQQALISGIPQSQKILMERPLRPAPQPIVEEKPAPVPAQPEISGIYVPERVREWQEQRRLKERLFLEPRMEASQLTREQRARMELSKMQLESNRATQFSFAERLSRKGAVVIGEAGLEAVDLTKAAGGFVMEGLTLKNYKGFGAFSGAVGTDPVGSFGDVGKATYEFTLGQGYMRQTSQIGPGIMQNPEKFAGEQIYYAAAPIYAKVIGKIAWNVYVKSFADKVKYSTKLADTPFFTTESAEETLKAFEATRGKTVKVPAYERTIIREYTGQPSENFIVASESLEGVGQQVSAHTRGGKLRGTHLTPVSFTFEQTALAPSFRYRDPGFYITPGGKGQSYFLRLSDDVVGYEFSLNPFKAIDRPTNVDVLFKNIKPLPQRIIDIPEDPKKPFMAVYNYLTGKVGKETAYVTKGSTLRITSEGEAVLPFNTIIQQRTTQAKGIRAFIQRQKGFSQYFKFEGVNVPIVEYDVLARRSQAQALGPRAKTLGQAYDEIMDYTSYQRGIRTKTPYSGVSKISNILSYGGVSPPKTTLTTSPIVKTQERFTGVYDFGIKYPTGSGSVTVRSGRVPRTSLDYTPPKKRPEIYKESPMIFDEYYARGGGGGKKGGGSSIYDPYSPGKGRTSSYPGGGGGEEYRKTPPPGNYYYYGGGGGKKPPAIITRPIIQPPQTPTSVYPARGGKKKRRGEGYVVRAKERGKYITLNKKPLNYEAALSLGARAVDNSAAASFMVRRDKRKRPVTSRVDPYYGLNRYKFRQSKRGGSVVEKRRYRIDTPGEVRKITVKGWMAQRRKKRGLI